MATGLGNKLTGQIGEHLVTAELGRRGIIATPFAGNVPAIDILGHTNGITGHIQVKAITGDSSWQFDIRKFLDIKVVGKAQKISGINKELDRNIICVFVLLGDSLGQDQFYIFEWGWLQDYFKETYKARKAPKKYESFHCAIWRDEFPSSFVGNWKLIQKRFKVSSNLR